MTGVREKTWEKARGNTGYKRMRRKEDDRETRKLMHMHTRRHDSRK